MDSVAILGSGFGLYGYLPAMIGAGTKNIILPERYKPKYLSRPELARFADAIRWMKDEREALANASCAVIALRPDLQEQWLDECLKFPNIKCVLLEKPLARTPDLAKEKLDSLVGSGKAFRIGYIFRFTSWGKTLLKDIQRSAPPSVSDTLRVSWSFLAHHYRNSLTTWKRDPSSGGGALRFYGIHIIALLAELGYDKVTSSTTFQRNAEDMAEWAASFSGSGLPQCDVRVDTAAASTAFLVEHQIEGQTKVIADLLNPFAEEESRCGPGELDGRVSLLSNLCYSVQEEQKDAQRWYRSTIDLWAAVERCNEIKSGQ